MTTKTPARSGALELRGITRRFGSLVANQDVDFVAKVGEVHALVGENGAGKSTLMHIAYGLLKPDEGSIWIAGKQTGPGYNPRVAMANRLGMVHQHFMLMEPMTVVENVVLGREPTPAEAPWSGVLDLRRAAREIREVAGTFGLGIDPEARVSDLSVGEKQRVEIVKALWRGCDVLILDEPTAVLSPKEVQTFFDVLRSLTVSGMAVILITHKLDEVLAIADRITVLRGGRMAGELDAEGASAEGIARAMVGRPVLLNVDKKPASPKKVMLGLGSVSVRRARGDIALDSLDLEVRSGEIVGIAGVEGNGQSELIEAICGLRAIESGSVAIDSHDVTEMSVGGRRRAGLVHIPEDRHSRGLILEFSTAENLILGRSSEFSRAVGLDQGQIYDHAARQADVSDIRPRDTSVTTANLSGGNQQKIVIARELGTPGAKVLVASQPTRGVDVGAIERIHRELIRARDEGMAIVLLSAELSEILSLSDRVIVLYRGKAVAELDSAELREPTITDRIGSLMMGVTSESADLDGPSQ